MVDLPLPLLPHIVHESMEQDRDEGNQLGEDQPDIDHLDVCGGRKGVGDRDEERGEDKLGGQVHRHHRLEEERFEEVGGVDNTKNEPEQISNEQMNTDDIQ